MKIIIVAVLIRPQHVRTDSLKGGGLISGEENKGPHLTVKINLAHAAQYVSNDFQITCHLIY